MEAPAEIIEDVQPDKLTTEVEAERDSFLKMIAGFFIEQIIPGYQFED